jgi:hypothetical protein
MDRRLKAKGDLSPQAARRLKVMVLILASFLGAGLGVGSAAYGHLLLEPSRPAASGRRLGLGELQSLLHRTAAGGAAERSAAPAGSEAEQELLSL